MKYFLLLPTLIFSSSLCAWESTPDTTIQVVYLNSVDNLIFVKTAHEVDDNNACSSSGYNVIEPGQPLARELYSAALAAKTAQSTVTVGVNGCVGSYPKINAIHVK